MSGAIEALLVGPADGGAIQAVAIRQGRADDRAIVAGGEAAPGAVHRGRVVRLVPALRAAFVDIGLARPALLDLGNASVEPGTPLTVQIIEAAAGDKAARVSRRVALAGRYVVALAGGRGTAASKRADDDTAAALAARLVPPAGVGFLLRRGAGNADPAAVEGEAAALAARAATIAAASGEPPCCLLEADPVAAVLSDFAGAGIAQIVTASAALARTIRTLAPDLASLVEATEEGAALFDRYDAADALAAAEAPTVALAAGGRITIERTAALVAIDVDTGSATDADAGGRVNAAAAEAIARQMRLRDLGGLIVIDFVRMEGAAARLRPRILARLAKAAAVDRQPVEVLGFTAGGLCEVVRGRTARRGA